MTRINKYIASCTGYSRRKAEELVLAGRVKVSSSACPVPNGARVIPDTSLVIPAKAGIQPAAEVVTNLATEIKETDKVFLDDKPLKQQTFIYYALNKPMGYTTTTSDPHAKKLITELVPKDPPVFPVGRLDKNTSGLIFLTNDGDFAQRMTHPKYEKEKEYIFETDKPLSKEALEQLQKGVMLDDGMTAPATIQIPAKVPNLGKHGITQNLYSITIHEGRNRQIRRMIEEVGAKVVKLKRVRIGEFELKNLGEGKYKTFKP